MFSEFQKCTLICTLIYFVCASVPIRCLADGEVHHGEGKETQKLLWGENLQMFLADNKRVSDNDSILTKRNSGVNLNAIDQIREKKIPWVTETAYVVNYSKEPLQNPSTRNRRSISESPVDRVNHGTNKISPSISYRRARTQRYEEELESLPGGSLKVSGRQSNVDSNIENVIRGIMKLLGEKVKITTAEKPDTQITTFTDIEPTTIRSRINNRGPPRLPDIPFGLLPEDPGVTVPPIRPPISPPPSVADGQPPYVANTRPPFLVPLPPQLTFDSPMNKPFLNGIPLPVNVLPGNDKELLSPEEDDLVEPTESPSVTIDQDGQPPKIELDSTLDIDSVSTTSSIPTPSLETTTTLADDTVKTTSEKITGTDYESEIETESDITIRATSTFTSTTKVSEVSTQVQTKPSLISRSRPSVQSTRPIYEYPSLPTRLPDPIRPYATTGHAGIVLEDSVSPHVITAPLPHQNIFDVTVSAIQGYNGGGPPVIQKPVNLGGPLITSAVTPGDGVFIDGRKSYFNLVPVTGSKPIQQTLGVGTVIPEDIPNVPYNSGAPKPVPQAPSGGNIPGSYKPTVSSKPSTPKRESTYRPTLGPPKRIDTCIVGYDTTCKKELGEVCRTEGDVSSCFCKPGTARKRARSKCKKSVVLHLSLKVDRVGDRRIIWGVNYANPEAREYQILSYEASKALDSAFNQARGMTNLYLGSTVNKFYSLGGRVIVNSTIHLVRTPQTSSTNIKRNLQRHLIRVIRANNNYVGNSVLVVEGPLNPIPDVSDVNECFDPVLNDCHSEASCINTFGSFTCSCEKGYTDRNSDNPDEAGRKCLSCSKDFCSKRGICKVINEEKVCECEDSYYGSRCEIDGEVIAVAVGASVAAVVIIILTLIFLCMWSRKWKDQDRKAQLMNTAAGFFGWRNRLPADPGYTMGMHSKGNNSVYGAALEDRIRWSHMAETMAQQNIYAQPDQMRPAISSMYQEKRKMGPPPSEYASVGTVGSSFPQQFGMHCMNPPNYGPMHNNGPPSFSQFTSTSINAASMGGVSRATTLGARTPQPLRDSSGFQSLGPLGGGTAEHFPRDSAHHNESSEEEDRPYHLPRPKSRGSMAVGVDTSRLARSYNSLLF